MQWWNRVAKQIATLQHMGIERTLELRECKIAEMIRDEYQREEIRLMDADMMAVTNCEKLRVARKTRAHWQDRAKKAEGDTRELKAALTECVKQMKDAASLLEMFPDDYGEVINLAEKLLG